MNLKPWVGRQPLSCLSLQRFGFVELTLIWLDKLSPSAAWAVADIAWENDLERVEDAA